jgi:rRNA-processing protein FCF1
MKKIILDTNFLTLPHQFKVDIFSEIDRIMEENYELFTLDSVIDELNKLSKSKGKDAIAAKIGLELIKKKNIKIIKTGEINVDKAIVKISNKDTIVATNDKILRKKLKNENIKTIYLRSKKYFEIG